MPVLSGGDAANDNRSTGAADRPCLRLGLASEAWSGTTPAAETVAWIEAAWCRPVETCPATDSRLVPAGPD